MLGYKPQGTRKGINANTNTPPQDPPPPPKLIIPETPTVPIIVTPPPPKVTIVKKNPIVQKKITIKPLTLRQRIIVFLKRIMRK